MGLTGHPRSRRALHAVDRVLLSLDRNPQGRGSWRRCERCRVKAVHGKDRYCFDCRAAINERAVVDLAEARLRMVDYAVSKGLAHRLDFTPRPSRFITIGHREYEVVWDGA